MIGEKRETFILTSPDNAYTLANEIKADHNIHIASAVYHKAADTSNAVTSTDATTLATLYTLVNEIKSDFNTHEASTTYHREGSANVISSADATSAVTAYELLTELKEKYNKHIASVTYHMVADTSNPIATLASKVAAVNKDFNADGGSVLVELTGAGSWDGTVDFQTTPDGATFFNIPYISRSTITPTPTVAQISSPSTAAIYLLLGPLSQVRIACATGTQGTLTVVFRTIQKSDLVVAYLVAGTNAIGKLAANSGVDIGDVDILSIAAGNNRIGTVSGVLKSVSVTKALEAAVAYTAGDVLCETDTASAGTAWTFAAIARANGAKGYITKAQVISETTAITPRLTLFLFHTAPTCELDDNAANTALLHADEANYIGKIDFPAMEDIGTGDSEAVATPSTVGNLPLEFECAAAADDLIGVLVTRDAFTQTATDDMIVKLTVEQY